MKYILVAVIALFLTGTALALACNKQSAQQVQGMIQSMAKVTRDSGFISVKWGNDFNSWTMDQKFQMAQTAANTDACLSGVAREMRFYSPAGRLNAVASPTSGIRLVD